MKTKFLAENLKSQQEDDGMNFRYEISFSSLELEIQPDSSGGKFFRGTEVVETVVTKKGFV